MMTDTRLRWEQRINGAVNWTLRHWLLCVNALVLLYCGVPWLAPLAEAGGYPRLGRLLFLIYTPLCHQRPERSFFLLGHQVAYCHRCTAMYTSLLVVGLAFGPLRRKMRPAPLWVAGLLLLPMLLDGGSHMIDDLLGLGLRGGGDGVGTLNFWLRMVTGVLFAVAVLVAIYPRLERDLSRAHALATA